MVDQAVVAGVDRHHLRLETLLHIMPHLLRENLQLGKLVHTQQEQLAELLVLIREEIEEYYDRNNDHKLLSSMA